MKYFKNIVSGIIAVFFLSTLSAQQLSKAQADQQAQHILNQYQADLELTIEQAPKFHQIVSKYLLKKNEIENKALVHKLKESALAQNSALETNEIAAILGGQQLKVYKKLKPKIQPL